MWIAVRTDGHAGTGTQADPYDGSTAQKFDALLQNYRYVQNVSVHLVGTGPFLTDTRHTWAIGPGWTISGDGMDVTTLKMVGNIAGIHYNVRVIGSDPNIAADNIVISDLTCDANWPELSLTADTGSGGEKNVRTGAIAIWGSNCLVERVRSINTYGSWANLQEVFAISVSAARTADATSNIIRSCRAEQPYGNYGNPFALAGWVSPGPVRYNVNCMVTSCTAVGLNNGLPTGFTSGGVNFGNVKECYIVDNTFTDCYGAAYTDTGSCDGVYITNNTVIRGWEGIGLSSHEIPKHNIQVVGNSFQVQNRVPGGGSYGIAVAFGAASNLVISNNTVTFDTSGGGLVQFWGLTAVLLNTAMISDNTIATVNMGYGVTNNATGFGLTMFNNRTPDGTPIPLLNNQ